MYGSFNKIKIIDLDSLFQCTWWSGFVSVKVRVCLDIDKVLLGFI